MKTTIITALFLAIMSIVFDANAEPKDDAASTEGVRFNRMVQDVCQKMSLAAREDVRTISRDIEDAILAYNGWDRSTDAYRIKFSDFFNTHSSKFICMNDSHIYSTEHLFQRAVNLRIYEPVLINLFLVDENEYPIDVNVVTTNFRGEQETLLDMVDDILASSNAALNFDVSDIRELREILVTFYGAKHASELLEE